MTKYTTECSCCRFIYSGTDSNLVQQIANKHEQETGHRGPFVWALTDAMQAILQKA